MSNASIYSFLASVIIALSFLVNLVLYLILIIFGIEYTLFNTILLLTIGLFLLCWLVIFVDIMLPKFFEKNTNYINFKPIKKPKISVAMTCYNDERSTGDAVKDFLNYPSVIEVVAVDNNSTDKTAEVAKAAGARVIRETNQGYGYACIRALKEAKGDIIVLVESDRTYMAYDIKKMLAYLENVDMVLGSRTTFELINKGAKMDWFLNWGNIFLAKLIQMKYDGKVRLTDVGCTYKAIKKKALKKIINQLTIGDSHFSPQMIMVALKNNTKTIEIPITYHQRIGESKVFVTRKKAFKLGLKMLHLILTFK